MNVSASTAIQSHLPAYQRKPEMPEGERAVVAQEAKVGDRGDAASDGRTKAVAEQALNPDQQRVVLQLQIRDREVKAHESAHMAAAAGLVRGGMSFSYQTGPDGRRYAVGGEVSIDSAPVADDPQATLDKAQQIQAAALAPAEPSSQDRAVAAQAARMAMEARVELAQQRREAADELPVQLSTRNALNAYGREQSPQTPSVLDQTV